MAKKIRPGKYDRKKAQEIPLLERDGAVEAIQTAFKRAAEEAKRVAAAKFLDRDDVAAYELRDLGTLFMLCREYPADAVENGCEHIRKNSPMFEGRR